MVWDCGGGINTTHEVNKTSLQNSIFFNHTTPELGETKRKTLFFALLSFPGK